MLRTVGRKAPRGLRQKALAIAPPVEQATVTELASTSEVHSSLQPLYVALSDSLEPAPSDPTPSETLVALDPTVFKHPIRRDILYLCVNQYRDGLRQGSANSKTRGEVAGSGRKIRPQKGSGRARLGDAQSPMLHGGGVAFGPKPRDFSTKLPRKIIDMGMRVALSAKIRENALGIMNHMQWTVPKTGALLKRLTELQMTNTLLVTGEAEVPTALTRAIGNLKHMDVMNVNDLKIVHLLKSRRVVFDAKAVESLEQKLSRLAPRVSI